MEQSPSIHKPALQEYLERVYGGRYQVQVTDVAVGAAVGQLVPNNFERMGLTLINLGAEPCYVSPDPLTSATHGIFLSANGGNVSLVAINDLVLTGYSWYAIETAGATTVTCIEVLRFVGDN